MKLIQTKCPNCGQILNVKQFPTGTRLTCTKCRKELMLDEKCKKEYLKYSIFWIVTILLSLTICNALFPGQYMVSLVILLFLFIVGPILMHNYISSKDIFHYVVDPTKKDWKYDGEGNYYNEEGERVDYLHPRKAYQTIERYMTKELMKDGGTVIDSRSLEEYKAGHIKDSIQMDLEHVEEEHELKLSGKHKFYVVYGETRKQSSALCMKLNELGYMHMCDLGELSKWDEPLVSEE